MQCEEATDKLMSAIRVKLDHGKYSLLGGLILSFLFTYPGWIFYLIMVGFDSLQATKERILLFQSYGNEFAQRLCDFLFKMFQSQVNASSVNHSPSQLTPLYLFLQSAAYLNDEARSSKKGSLKIYGHDAIEEKMYRFRKLLIWLKEVDARRSTELQMVN